MASKAGIRTAETKLIPISKRSILLSKRFDRTTKGKRIHFASALTLLGLTDGDKGSTDYGYLDIVDFILQYGAASEKDIQELYRRVAFSIIIGNSDDHFRNHGFLLTSKGWMLSPAYDLNPSLSEHKSLLINDSTIESNLDLLLDSASDYMLIYEETTAIIRDVKDAMQSWRTEAHRLNLPKREIEMFAPRIDRWV